MRLILKELKQICQDVIWSINSNCDLVEGISKGNVKLSYDLVCRVEKILNLYKENKKSQFLENKLMNLLRIDGTTVFEFHVARSLCETVPFPSIVEEWICKMKELIAYIQSIKCYKEDFSIRKIAIDSEKEFINEYIKRKSFDGMLISVIEKRNRVVRNDVNGLFLDLFDLSIETIRKQKNEKGIDQIGKMSDALDAYL